MRKLSIFSTILFLQACVPFYMALSPDYCPRKEGQRLMDNVLVDYDGYLKRNPNRKNKVSGNDNSYYYLRGYYIENFDRNEHNFQVLYRCYKINQVNWYYSIRDIYDEWRRTKRKAK